MCLKKVDSQNTSWSLTELLITVHRVIDGAELDEQDKAITAYVSDSFFAHAEYLDDFEARVKGSKTYPRARPHDSFLTECLWRASRSLKSDLLPAANTIMMRRFALMVTLVGQGYKAPAEQIEDIVDRAYHHANNRTSY